MILVLAVDKETYFNVVHLNGMFGAIELVDGVYRAEHYDESIEGHSVNDNDFFNDADMIHDGEHKTIEKAVIAIVKGMGVSHPYLEHIINNKTVSDNHDWLVKVSVKENIDKQIQEWIKESREICFNDYAKESRKEAEYFETHEPESEEEISECWNRAEYLEYLCDLVSDL